MSKYFNKNKMKEMSISSARAKLARDLAILVFTVLLLTVPFINQAFHWDDRDFIEQARVAAKDPLQFYYEDYSSRGRFFEIYPFRHPPLISWYLAPVIRAGGESEPLLHGAYLVFRIATLSMYSLARRFPSSTGRFVAVHLYPWLSGDVPYAHGKHVRSRLLAVGIGVFCLGCRP